VQIVLGCLVGTADAFTLNIFGFEKLAGISWATSLATTVLGRAC
jgi:hypothetical protein